MRSLLLLAALGTAFAAGPDPREIVRGSLAVYERDNDLLEESYAFLANVETRRLNGDGSVRSTESKTHEVLIIEGTPYRRLVDRGGKPLPPEEQREQEEALRKAIEERRKESPAQRAHRIEEYQKRRTKYRKAIREIPDAFVFRLAGEEVVDSRPAYVIEATPKPGYDPVERFAKLFTGLKGTIWIDKTNSQWVRLEAELIDTISFGWILVRIGKGARVRFERTLVNGEAWLPSTLWYTVQIRVGLVKTHRVEERARFLDYRKLPGEGAGFR